MAKTKFYFASVAVATPTANGLMSAAMVAKLNGIADNANNYTHPTGNGNNHIPAGGSSGQILRWSSAGAAVWGSETAVPTKTSQLTNDSGYITSANVPTKTSQLTNDSGYVTSVPTQTSQLTNNSGFIVGVVGTAEATTSNCPSGAWYGQYS